MCFIHSVYALIIFYTACILFLELLSFYIYCCISVQMCKDITGHSIIVVYIELDLLHVTEHPCDQQLNHTKFYSLTNQIKMPVVQG